MSTRWGAVAVATLWAALANPVGAGGEKVHTVGPDGLSIEGEVKVNSPTLKVKSPFGDFKILAEPYEVTLEKGKAYVLTLNGKNIDSYLIVQDDSGNQVGMDDDGGGGLNSKLRFSPANSGKYKVHAGSLGNRPGAFVLGIKVSVPVAVQKLELKGGAARLDGKLNGDDIVYVVQMKKDKSYRISLNSEAFDTYLYVKDATGAKDLASNDDYGGTLNSRLSFRPTADGDYRIVASSFGGGAAGPFTLEIQEETQKKEK